jgi:hypothetical protein
MGEGERFIWCLVANVAGSHREAGGVVHDKGTKRFAPGAKFFCFPHQTGDRIRGLGRHRGGGPRLVESVISPKELVNWRAQKILRPDVLSLMADVWDGSESSRILAEQIAAKFISTSDKAPMD